MNLPPAACSLAALVAITLSAATPARAALSVVAGSAVQMPVPDNDPTGILQSQSVVTNLTAITGVEVRLSIGGGWNGDLYIYLWHEGHIAVLLNRPGRSAQQLDGVGSSGLAVTFADGASADSHAAFPDGGFVMGVYQPDARNIDPANVLATDPRTAFLSSFTGLNPNGTWSLFAADLAAGETAMLESWELTIYGVPEPSTPILAMIGMIAFALRRRRTTA